MTATAEQVTHISINIDGHVFHKTPEEALRLAASISVAARPQSAITPGRILSVVSSYYDYPTHALVGRGRPEKLAFARQVAMYWMRKLIPEMSLGEIGAVLGGRDHGTITYGCKAVYEDITCDTEYGRLKRMDVGEIGKILTGEMAL